MMEKKVHLDKPKQVKVNPERIETICRFLDNPDNRFLNLRSDRAFKGGYRR